MAKKGNGVMERQKIDNNRWMPMSGWIDDGGKKRSHHDNDNRQESVYIYVGRHDFLIEKAHLIRTRAQRDLTCLLYTEMA